MSDESNVAVLERARASRDANIAGDLTGIPEDQRAAVIEQRRREHFSAKAKARWAKREMTAKDYYQAHQEEIREYTRTYAKEWRARKKAEKLTADAV